MEGILALLLGLVVGSFLNVVIHRLPQGASIIKPRSACPGCGHVLGPADLIPVLSYLLLRGRCRYCGAGISWRYPLVEALTGITFLLLVRRFGLGLDFAVFAASAALLIAIAGIDLGTMFIPDVLVLPGLGLGLLYGLVRGDLTNALVGALVGGGSLLAVYFGALFLLKKEGLGLGDVELLGMIGSFLGWQGALFTIFLGSLLGALAGAIMMALGRLRRSQPMPFGPYLAAAGLVLVIWPWWTWLGPIFGF